MEKINNIDQILEKVKKTNKIAKMVVAGADNDQY